MVFMNRERDAQVLHAPLLVLDEEQPVLEILSGERSRVRVREEVIEREGVRGRDCRAAVIIIQTNSHQLCIISS